LEKWMRMGIVTPSTSPYYSPLLAVRKKDGTHRFCLDCRHLNSQTVFDAEPITDTTAIFTHLAGKTIFSKMDLTSGYWQVPLHPESRQYTAFNTRSDLYEFKVMPFGLANAPATFSRLIRQVTAGLQDTEVYMDDILLASTTW
ncbi:Reverse transcriptase domain, partial [Trinorchestia longiramus]